MTRSFVADRAGRVLPRANRLVRAPCVLVSAGRGGEHNAVEITPPPLELAWSIGPSSSLMGLFVWGFKNYMDQLVPPRDALEIRVTGKKWKWTFEYPNGAQSADEFAVPLNKPVKLIITSNDVLHNFFVPGFRMKMDAVPNKLQRDVVPGHA